MNAGEDKRRLVAGVAVIVTMVIALAGTAWFLVEQGHAIAWTTDSKRPYIDAMVQSARTSTREASAPAIGSTRCVAAAIVHGYGVRAFANAGLMPSVLRHPDATLHALAPPTAAQIKEIGTAAQLCGVGPMLAGRFGLTMHISNHKTLHCLGDGFDHDTEARGFVVFGVLGRPPDLMAAHGVVMVVAKCADPARLLLDASGVALTPTEKSCLVAAGKPYGEILHHRLAETITGQAPSHRQLRQLFGAGVDRCVSRARRVLLAG